MWPEIIVDEWIKSALKGIGSCIIIMLVPILFMLVIAGVF